MGLFVDEIWKEDQIYGPSKRNVIGSGKYVSCNLKLNVKKHK